MEMKEEKLKAILRETGSCAVAFSGGVDSAYLLSAAHEVLGEKAAAITAVSEFFPARETEEAVRFCRERGIRQIIVRLDVLAVPGIRENPRNRCYLCKTALFTRMKQAAREEGFAVLAEGSNLDDEGDYRPGLLAIKELGIRSPLREAGLTKAEIRTFSEERDLPTWNKPSFACLASRFVYGETVDREKLSMVDRGEEVLRKLGFSQYRVRIHGTAARIELLPQEIGTAVQPEMRKEIACRLREIGFTYISLDLDGYRTGSMNEALAENGTDGIKKTPAGTGTDGIKKTPAGTETE